MSNRSIENDSFDDALANIDLPKNDKDSHAPSEPKKPKLVFDDNDDEDMVLANIEIPSTTFEKVVPAAKANWVLVNPKQRGNPVLKSISNAPWEFDETIIPDYVVGSTAGILFLSLRYHILNPDYIHDRLKSLGKRFELRVLLVQVDTKDPHHSLKNLTQICLLADLTLMLAWSAEEAGQIIETYKLLENKPPDMIMARAQQFPHQKLVTALTNIKPVNKTDALTLIRNYGTLEKLIMTNEDSLAMCSGLGPRKAKRLTAVFNEPFLNK